MWIIQRYDNLHKWIENMHTLNDIYLHIDTITDFTLSDE